MEARSFLQSPQAGFVFAICSMMNAPKESGQGGPVVLRADDWKMGSHQMGLFMPIGAHTHLAPTEQQQRVSLV